MTDLDPQTARLLANTLLGLLPEYQLGREDVARRAHVVPGIVEQLYAAERRVDPAQVAVLATYLGIDVDRYAAAVRKAHE